MCFESKSCCFGKYLNLCIMRMFITHTHTREMVWNTWLGRITVYSQVAPEPGTEGGPEELLITNEGAAPGRRDAEGATPPGAGSSASRGRAAPTPPAPDGGVAGAATRPLPAHCRPQPDAPSGRARPTPSLRASPGRPPPPFREPPCPRDRLGGRGRVAASGPQPAVAVAVAARWAHLTRRAGRRAGLRA